MIFSFIIKKAMTSFKKIFNVLLVLVTFFVPIFLIIYFAKDIRSFEKIILSTGILAPLISVGIMGLLSATPIPTDPIVIINGAIFGPFIGIIVSWMGNNLAAVIEYFLGKGIGQISDFDKQKKKLPFGLGKFPANSPWFLICGRFIPQFGGKLVSIVAGLNHVKLSRYLWTAFLSNLFGSILLAYGGHALLFLNR
jgi:uncharacterized membrane protein YdjX (TVP38/TMEM64 family)